jgi:protein-S-isoprenylcysteine O-methyltransferase Ste14
MLTSPRQGIFRRAKAMKDEIVDNTTASSQTPTTFPKARRQVCWNWIRARLPLLLLIGLLALVKPHWSWWGLPILLLGQGLRTWAAGYIHKDRQLASGGPYGVCRHPLYLGTFLSCIGVCGLVGSWLAMVIFTVIFALVYIPTIRQEEAFMHKAYGEEYQAYVARVPAFCPLPGRRSGELSQGGWQWSWLLRNEEHYTWFAMVVFFILMAVKQHFSG